MNEPNPHDPRTWRPARHAVPSPIKPPPVASPAQGGVRRRIGRVATLAAMLTALVSLSLAHMWLGQRDDAQRALGRVETKMKTLQQQLDVLQSQNNAPPDFGTVAWNFSGPCTQDSCPVSGSFRNNGGQGAAVAIFRITNQDGST